MYNQLIDDTMHLMTEALKKERNPEWVAVETRRLDALEQSKEAGLDFQKAVFQLLNYYLVHRDRRRVKKVITLEEARTLATFTSLVYHEHLNYHNFSTKELAFISEHVKVLPVEEEKTFVERFALDDTISLLCKTVPDPIERSYYLEEYENSNDLRQNILKKEGKPQPKK